MKKSAAFPRALLFVFWSLINPGVFSSPIFSQTAPSEALRRANFFSSQDSLQALRLVAAYPRHLAGYSGGYIFWKDGTQMLFDDGCPKTEDETFDDPDLQDQTHGLTYAPGPPADTPGYNCDPGTFRYQPFFEKMYGRTEAEVKGRLVKIPWFPRAKKGRPGATLKVTRVNRVDSLLTEIALEIERSHPELIPWMTNIGGVFNWRNILGTPQRSAHAYAIAIDLNTKQANYWKWDYLDWLQDATERNIRWRNRVPLKLVEIFERRCFIWGGKWYHYDTMHFEYRPELF